MRVGLIAKAVLLSSFVSLMSTGGHCRDVTLLIPEIPTRAVVECESVRASELNWSNASPPFVRSAPYMIWACYEPYWARAIGVADLRRGESTVPLNAKGFAKSFSFSLPIGAGDFSAPAGKAQLPILQFTGDPQGGYVTSEDGVRLFGPVPFVYEILYMMLPQSRTLKGLTDTHSERSCTAKNWFGEEITCYFNADRKLSRTTVSGSKDPRWNREAHFEGVGTFVGNFPSKIIYSWRAGERGNITTITVKSLRPLASVDELLDLLEVPAGTWVQDYGTGWETTKPGLPTLQERHAHARKRLKSSPQTTAGKVLFAVVVWGYSYGYVVPLSLGAVYIILAVARVFRRRFIYRSAGDSLGSLQENNRTRGNVGLVRLSLGVLLLFCGGALWFLTRPQGSTASFPSSDHEEQIRAMIEAARKRVEVELDLGVVGSREGATTEVVVRNPVPEPLTFERAMRCDCLSVQVDPSPIPPLGEAKVTVSLKPRESGPFGEQLYFKNSKGQAFIVLDVTARVLASCEPDPGLLEIRVDPAYQRPDVVLGEFALVCREESLAPRGMEFCVEQPWVKCRRIAKEGDRVRYQLRLTDVPPVGEHELAWCSPRGQARRSFQPDLPVVRLRVVSPVRVEPAVLDLGIGRVGTELVGRVSVGDSATSVTVCPGPGWDAQIASYCVERDGSGPPQVKVTLRSSQPVALEGMLDVEAEQPGGPLHRFRLQVLGACQ
ncbi:hypothetical protein BRCON_2871 [Candidatus Sumerlaea chitinivorans]|uniref:DUF1573 domain-containing protein n=1 Tax=Sumerlaea chitinivorans TaxID=2250252 RepID=A0A2Z4YB28_SUMC1|nr:hypothetical protein BRCON_2871 [Candidatus Sumerlaea chitinivorans]